MAIGNKRSAWLVLLCTVASSATAAVAEERSLRAIEVPLQLRLHVDEREIESDAPATITLIVTARTALERLRASATTMGPVTIAGEIRLEREVLARDESIELAIPVRYGETGLSEVTVEIEATDIRTGDRFARPVTLRTLLRPDRAFAGMDHELNLRTRAVTHDLDAARITAAEAADRLKRLRMLDHETAAAPPAPAGVQPSESRPAAESGFATITVTGDVFWRDANDDLHPVFGMIVEIRDAEAVGSVLIDQVVTGQDGHYGKTVSVDDGALQGDPDIFVRFRTENAQILVRPIGGSAYTWESVVHDETPHGTTIIESLICPNTGTGPACSVLSGMTFIATYHSDRLNGGVALAQIPVEWPGDNDAACYNGSRINMRPADQFSWDVMHHEYGHYVMDSHDFEANPGLSHGVGQCLSNLHLKDAGTRLAWGEAWPTFFAMTGQFWHNLAAQGIPTVGDFSYTDTFGVHYDLEPNTTHQGEDNEIAVQRLLFDLWDGTGETGDDVVMSDLALFDLFDGTNVTRLSAAWGLLRASNLVPDKQTDLAVGDVAELHGVGPDAMIPMSGSSVAQGRADFIWTEAVGCATAFDGDDFEVVFYNPLNYMEILSVPVSVDTSTGLTDDQFDTVIAGSADKAVIWAVEAKNISAPVTGPYLGDHEMILVRCKEECGGPIDSQVGIDDFLALLAAWGTAGHPCDIDNDGVVSISDFLALLAAWGECPP